MHALPPGQAPNAQPPLSDETDAGLADAAAVVESDERVKTVPTLTEVTLTRLSDGYTAAWRAIHARNWRYPVVLAISILALAAGLLNFALIVGAVPVPVAGLRPLGQETQRDNAVYSFEYDNEGWKARGAATTAIENDTHVFAGHGALEFQATNLTDTNQAFVYIGDPPTAKPGAMVSAHIFIPQGAPALVAAIFTLDGAWAWQNGQFATLNPGQWTAVIYHLPQNARAPIHQLGIIVVGEKGGQPYVGPIFVDSIDLEKR